MHTDLAAFNTRFQGAYGKGDHCQFGDEVGQARCTSFA